MEPERDAIQLGLNETLAYMAQCLSSRAFFFLTRTVFIIVIGPILFGNLLVLASVIKFKNLHKTMYILIGNLAVADLLLGAGLLITVAYSIYTPLKESQYLCLTHYSLIATSQLASIGNIALMSVERFLAIKYPLKHHVYAQNRKIVTSCIVVTWMIYIFIGFLPLLGVNNYSSEIKFPCYVQLIISEIYEIICMFIIITLLSFTLSLSMYVFKTAVVKNRHTKRGSKTQQMLVVFCVHFLCWTPFIVTTAILRLDYSRLVRYIRDWVSYLGLTNSAFNWTIYGLLNPKMRQAFGNIVCCCKKCKRNTQTSE